jgi:hypothetical protein
VIEIPRGLARQVRAVLRRCLTGRGPHGPWPLLLCRAGRHGLTLEASLEELAVRHDSEGERAPDVLAFRSSVLGEFEGRGKAAVALEQPAGGQGRARWSDGGVPRALQFETVTPDSAPAFPALPKSFAPLPAEFLPALAEAVGTTARESTRFALSRVLLRGKSGEVVATYGRQLLVQGGFALPWREDILVPRLPVFGYRDPVLEGPVGIGRTKTHVALRVGPWTFVLAIDTSSRYPRFEDVIPKPSAVTNRLRVAPEDAAFLTDTLPKLPGRDGAHDPVTLDLGEPVAVRARPDGQGPVTEAVLNRSRATGLPVRLHLSRRYLWRAVRLGFAEVEAAGPDQPLVCRDPSRTYVWMPLDKKAAIPPGPDVLRIASGEGAPPEPRPQPERRDTPMPAPPPNGRPTDPARSPRRHPRQPGREPEQGGNGGRGLGREGGDGGRRRGGGPRSGQ